MSHYQIVRICTAGTLTIRNRLDKEIESLENYESIRAKIIAGRYNYTDGFSAELCKRGHDAQDLLFDVEHLQKTWAKENNLPLEEGELWQKKIIFAQLKKLNPDIVFFQGVLRITPKDVESIRHELPNLKLIMLHCGFPHGLDVLTSDTVVFAGTPSIQKRFAATGVENHLLYHCFDERLLSETMERPKQHPFSFIGSSGYGYQHGHKTRYWQLFNLAHNTPIKLWLDEKVDIQGGIQNPFVERPLKEEFYQFKREISDYPSPFCPLTYLIDSDRANEPVYGIDFFQTLRDSLLTFHRHTDTVSREVGAMRLFQATGMGACLMTDEGHNLADLFEPDHDVIVYDSIAEAIEKANWLLENPTKAKEIAINGQNKTLAAHCHKHRVDCVEQVILDKIS